MKQVVRQIRERIKVELELNNIKYELWRLDDAEYRLLKVNSINIKHNFTLYQELYFSEPDNKANLNLAQLFITLTRLFGNSSNSFDSEKGSFIFPLLLIVKKSTGNFFYLIQIFDSRGWFEYNTYKLFENEADTYNNQMPIQAFESEFSRQEIKEFLTYLYVYLIQLFNNAKSLAQPEPFIKMIDSSFILYGYYNNQYFEEGYDDKKSYQQAIQRFSSVGLNAFQPQNINSLLETIISEVAQNYEK
jgi:hypothetical protein